MFSALQQALDLDEQGIQAFLDRLQAEQAIIAGSFPLLFCCQPRLEDWHPRTREEVRLLAWIAKQYGFPLPRLALERIGNLLQLAPFQADWQEGRVDIDIFQYAWATECLQPFGLTGWTRVPRDQIDVRGTYELIYPIHSVCIWKRGKYKLNVLNIPSRFDYFDWNDFIEWHFDLSFCSVRLDCPKPMRMRGLANLIEFDSRLRAIRDMYRYDGEGDHELQLRLADMTQKRLKKYKRRRFIVENRRELKRLIAHARILKPPQLKFLKFLRE